jgi:hypothetical protein
MYVRLDLMLCLDSLPWQLNANQLCWLPIELDRLPATMTVWVEVIEESVWSEKLSSHFFFLTLRKTSFSFVSQFRPIARRANSNSFESLNVCASSDVIRATI